MGIVSGLTTARNVASSGLQTVSNWRGYADGIVNKYILKPRTMKGINGFVFDASTEDIAQMSAEITDHYTESNFYINDHVAIRPMRVTLKGFVGELVYQQNNSGVLGLLETVQNALTTVPAYLGKYTPKGLQDIQRVITKGTSFVNKVDNYLARAKNIVGFFGNANKPNKQQDAYSMLKELFINRVICSVETPFEYFDNNMIIESLMFKQSDNDKYRTDIWVTLKEIRVATVTVTAIDKFTTAGRALYQRQPVSDNGKSKGSEVSWASKFTTGMRINRGATAQ